MDFPEIFNIVVDRGSLVASNMSIEGGDVV